MRRRLVRHLELELLPYARALWESTSARRLLLAGVGAGKTHALVVIAVLCALTYPHVNGAITAPTYTLFVRVVLPVWKKVVPSWLYVWRPGDQEIRMVNGVTIYCFGTLRGEDAVVGYNLGWALMDEAGVERDSKIPGLLMERLREMDEAFLALFTSPHGHTWLADWMKMADGEEDAVHVVTATTYDNPFTPARYKRNLELEYPPGTPLHNQEMMGRIVHRTGLVYGEVFSRAPAPRGHIIPLSYDYQTPYDLGWDPGLRASGVVAFQELLPGRQVAVRQWTPVSEATDMTARRIGQDMGKPPRRIFTDTPSKLTSGRTDLSDVQALRKIWPTASVRVASNRKRRGAYRHKAVVAALSRRDFLVSQDLVPPRLTSEERGLVYSLETLPWQHEPARDETVKMTDPRKHIVDATEFGIVHLLPPKFSDSEGRQRELADMLDDDEEAA